MKLAVWYHVTLSGPVQEPGGQMIDEDHAVNVMAEQMRDLKESGLAKVSQIHIASNGGPGNALLAAALAPNHARLIDNGPDAVSLLPTVCRLREWLPGHEDWAVCFFHAKGTTHPATDKLNRVWRECMERTVIGNWKRCVNDLKLGFDSVGAHWLTREKYGPQVATPFWGGMFFWATVKYLSTLPPIPERPTCRNDWFLSEGWIGMGSKPPRVLDYRQHWPNLRDCQ